MPSYSSPPSGWWCALGWQTALEPTNVDLHNLEAALASVAPQLPDGAPLYVAGSSNGGAMTVWGDDLMVVHRTGHILRLIEGEGLRDTPITAPDNGLAEYTALAASEDWRDYAHKPHRMRFNDLVYVDGVAQRGLAQSMARELHPQRAALLRER